MAAFRRKPGPLGLSLIAIAFALPMLSGVIQRFLTRGTWFVDYLAVACGAERAMRGAHLYDDQAACAGAARFVYGPWVAEAARALMEPFGAAGFASLYFAVYAAGLAVLIWMALFGGASTAGDSASRAPFLALSPGGVIINANIALPFHAAVGLGAQLFATYPWVFLLAVALAGAVKPVFLSYLTVVALSRRSPSWRAAAIVLTAAASLAPMAVFAAIQPAEAAAWTRLVGHFVYEATPGQGLLGWMASLGLPLAGPTGAVCALAWAALVTAAGAVIARRGALGDRDRIWLGLSCGVLANPRIMGQDLLLLGPGMVVALGAGCGWSPFLRSHGEHLVLAACGLALLSHLIGFNPLGARVATAILALLLLGAAAAALRRKTSRSMQEQPS
jgi:hypothetical protein